jgi:hypothetical protein
MRTILLASAVFVFSAVAAQAGPCPASVTDDVQPPGGGAAQVEHRFKDVSFYEGDPKQKDDVPSDDNAARPRQLEQHWELTRSPGKPITMVCRYHGTNKTYVAVVPDNVKGCTLSGEMDSHGEVAGSPTLECK